MATSGPPPGPSDRLLSAASPRDLPSAGLEEFSTKGFRTQGSDLKVV